MKAANALLVLCVVLGTSVFGSQAVVERGPHHNLIQNIESVEENGESVSRTNYFTELGSGLNFWSAEQSAYVPASDEIEILETGAIYQKGQYQLRFASNINDPNGTLEWTPEPDKHLIIQTIGIALVEEATGDSVWLGQIKDTQGFLTGRNEVTYASCFDQINADVRISVRPSGFENDVILKENIVDPATLGFQGSCRIEIWHNIISGPEPQLETGGFLRSPTRNETDTQLRFGPMYIGSGTAFLIGQEKEALSDESGIAIRVSKDYFIDPETQARFLIENVPLSDANAQLQTLPASNHAQVFSAKDKERMVAMRRQDGKRHRPIALMDAPASKTKKERIVAMSKKEMPRGRGLLMDFSSIVTLTNTVLAGDMTYVVRTNTTVNLSGNTVIEPGCVIKMGYYNPTNSTPIINILGTLDCQTRPFAPCVITSQEDRTIGETNTAQLASIATNAYGAYHLCIPASNTNAIQLHDIRSRYALNAFGFLGTNSVEAWNIQTYGTQGDVFEANGNRVTLRNILVHNANNVIVPVANNALVAGEHFTIHAASKTYSAGSYTGCSLNLTNSLLVVVTNSSSSGFTNISGTILTNDTGIFQSVGGGAHYLAGGSPYRDAGTTSISINLSAGVFKYSTTYPPVVLSNITANTTLSPQATRDLDTPDLGYHYPAIDWAASSVSVGNVTLLLTNGVSVAVYGTNGFALGSGAKLVSEGKATSMNRIVRYENVQEQPFTWGDTASIREFLASSSSASQLTLRQTEIGCMADDANRRNITYGGEAITILVRDCEFYSSYFTTTTQGNATVINNLFHRGGFTANFGPVNLDLKNNLFRYATASFSFTDMSWTWNVTDNLFDNAYINFNFNSPTCSNNARFNSTQVGGSVGGTTLGATDYQTGSIGKWYYPTSGTNLYSLADAGSQSSADAGLFHYTVRVDNTKDSGTVAVGYHYVAVDSGTPLDTDQDGIPDYLEDRNGNGSIDTGETDFLNAFDIVFVRITKPSGNSVAP